MSVKKSLRICRSRRHRGALATSGVIGLLLVVDIADVRTSQAADGSLGGMTGFINIPTARTLEDASVRFGVSFVDSRWAYNGRGTSNNTLYFVSLGFLPSLELSFRASVSQKSRFLENAPWPKVDRMGSARLRIIREGRGPAVAVGIDDVRGTRSHHALYCAVTKTLLKHEGLISTVISVGHGSKALRASRHVLDGTFGGIEIQALNRIALMLEYDTEKWNSGVRVRIARFSATLALLNLDTFSGGVRWTQSF